LPSAARTNRFEPPDDREEDEMLKLRDIMTREVRTLTPESSLRTAMELFDSYHVSGAPVMSGHRVVGVVSVSDVLAFLMTALQEPPARDADDMPDGPDGADELAMGDAEALPADDEPWTGGAADAGWRAWDPLGEHTVNEAMTYGVYALPPNTDVSAAADCMRSADVHRMLVMEEGRLLGIVTTMDLVRAVAEHRIVNRTYVFRRPGDDG
jgi:CBS domain-containing protein